MKKLLSLAVLCCSLAASAAPAQQPPHPLAECAGFTPLGEIKSTQSLRSTKICRFAYVTEYDLDAKVPVWTSYTILPSQALSCGKRKDAFAEDKSLSPADRVYPKDFAQSGYDKGHIVNAGDMLWDATAQQESFLMTNMAPQLPGFNRGIWKSLEDQVRAWAVDRKDSMLIMAGSIYTPSSAKLKSRVVVPDAFWKIVVDLKTKEYQAFIFPHSDTLVKADDDFSAFKNSLAEVQRRAKLVIPMPPEFKMAIWPVWTRSVQSQKAAACAYQPAASRAQKSMPLPKLETHDVLRAVIELISK